MNKIVVIGTQPPCPRCKLLTDIVTQKAAQMGLDATITHIAYSSQEAADVASDAGLVPGTAKDVAKKAGIEINWGAKVEIPQAYHDQIKDLEQNLRQYESLFKEVAILDNTLRPFETRAIDLGIMMTPVLIINGEIKHQGSVPWVSEIEKWMSALKAF